MSEQTNFDWRPIIRRRLITTAWVFGLWAVAVEARLVVLQIVERPRLQALADSQHLKRHETAARRGDILDREGRLLALTVDVDSIYAVPRSVRQPEQVAAALCGALGDCTARELETIRRRLGQKNAFAWMRRQVTEQQASRVAALGLPGIFFVKEPRRFYPNGELAAHVLGCVGVDGDGLEGIEAAYDRHIRGEKGDLLVHVDERGRAFRRLARPAVAGATLELTVDEYLQHIAERELRAGVEANRAAGGSVIIMDPATGEILALANEPTFDPNTFRDAPEVHRRNRAVQDLYEPGSTFKVVTASAAMEERVVSPSEAIDVSAGSIRFGSRLIEDVHRYGALSFTDVIVKSSNVGAIKVGLRLGAERLGRYVLRFGFGSRLSPDFPGENPGIVWSAGSWTESGLASVSMGYQVGVTPLQMAAAASAIANGGALMQPRVVRAMTQHGVRRVMEPRRIRRVTSAETASQLTAIMEAVVERGTGQAAQVPGFVVAGKTGTSQKIENGRYSRERYNASFVGFVPSRQPAFTIVVLIDSPRGAVYFGGPVAGPVFKRIAEAALLYRGVRPSLDPAPAVLVARQAQPPEVRTAGPAPLTPLIAAVDSDETVVPDLAGRSAREAVQLLARLGVLPRLSGTGVVVAQDPAAGTTLEPGTTCHLFLGDLPARARTVGPRP